MRTGATFLMLFCAAGLAGAQETGGEATKARISHWEEMDARVTGRAVELKTPSGIKLKGKVLAIEPDQLRMEVRSTSDRQAYPRGGAVVPRAEVRQLRIPKKSVVWKIVGGVIGMTLGGVGVYGLLATSEGAGVPPATIAGVVGLGTAMGVSVGHVLDSRRKTVIVIEPKPAHVSGGAGVRTVGLLPSWIGQPVEEVGK